MSSNLTVNKLTANSKLKVRGNTNMKKKLKVRGDIKAKGDVTIREDLEVSGDVTMKKDLEVYGDVTMKGDLNLDGQIIRKYDYVIVGFGTTACVVTRKLLDAGKSVLVLERGGNNLQKNGIVSDPIQAPVSTGTVNPELQGDLPWGQITVMKRTIGSAGNQRTSNYAEGNGWGGGGAHYYMNSYRGSAYCWDEFDVVSGGTGKWSYNTVLPFLKGMEKYVQRTNTSGPIASDRGTSGPMTVVQQDDWTTIQTCVPLQQFATIPQYGIGWTPDINSSETNSGVDYSGYNPVGVTFRQQANDLPLKAFGGTFRSSSLNSLMTIDKIIDEKGNGLNGKDIKVYSNILVNRVLFDGTKAIGVEYLKSVDKFNIKTVTTTPLTFPLPLRSLITSIVRTGVAPSTIALATTSTPHGYSVGSSIFIQNNVPHAYNGNFTVTNVPTTTTFEYTCVSGPVPDAVILTGTTGLRATINVASTAGFPTSGNLTINGFYSCLYTGITATTFTGVIGVGGQAGTITAGAQVAQGLTPTNANIDLTRSYTDLLESDYEVAYGENIILCAGAHNTPSILQRSGVGDTTLLTSLGIPVVVANSNVGENLASHYNLAGVTWTTGNVAAQPPVQPLPITTLSGGATMGANLHGVDLTPGNTYYYPNDGVRRFQVVPTNTNNTSGLPSVSISTNMYKPLSTGYIRITSKNPAAIPDGNLNLLTDPGSLVVPPLNGSDMNRCVTLLKWFQQIGIASSVIAGGSGGVGGAIEFSAAIRALSTDLQYVNFVKDNIGVQNHTTGTCRMGTSIANAVVDADLKVFGTTGLYCADASIFPWAIDGNINASLAIVALRLIDSLGLPTLPVV
jgi:choline dehydrogenase-like flavoprotein